MYYSSENLLNSWQQIQMLFADEAVPCEAANEAGRNER